MRTRLLIILTWLACTLHAFVYTPVTVPDPKRQGQNCYVSNPDALIGDSDVIALNRICDDLKSRTDVEMAIVCLDSINECYTMFDFGFEIFQTWGLGVKGKNTGILITLCQSRREVFFNTGTGIEGVMTDAMCHHIQQAYMIPSFREGDYSGGLLMGALAIYELCTEDEAKDELLNMQSVTQRGGFVRYNEEEENKYTYEMPRNGWIYIGKLLLFCIPIGLLCFLFMLPICYQRKKQSDRSEYKQRIALAVVIAVLIGVAWLFLCYKYILYIPALPIMMVVVYKIMMRYIRCPKCGRFCKHYYSSFTSVEPTIESEGVETHIYTCTHCHYKHTFKTVLPKASPSSDSDSDGYSSSSDSGGSWGGGSSSGGGAGSSW